jgi:hypothetical protein
MGCIAAQEVQGKLCPLEYYSATHTDQAKRYTITYDMSTAWAVTPMVYGRYGAPPSYTPLHRGGKRYGG